jgi:hypothetical protein
MGGILQEICECCYRGRYGFMVVRVIAVAVLVSIIAVVLA